MKTVILCGGRGTRLDRHGELVPKGLFRIGEDPLILHLFRIYQHYGLNDFALCLGHLAEKYGEYFDQAVQDPKKDNAIFRDFKEHRVGLFDTGPGTNTGGRIYKLRNVLDGDDTFCATYGDGLANVNLDRLIEFHHKHRRIATLTVVNPVSNFGLVEFDDSGCVVRFREKPRLREWVNGGFFVFNRKIFDYLDEDSVLEKDPFERLAAGDQLMAFRHPGFWKCMDTFKDNIELNEIWERETPWKVW